MVVGVTASNTVIHPDTMSLIPIGALVANLAVVRARWPDDLAVWAEFARRELAQKLRELKLIFALVIIVVDD